MCVVGGGRQGVAMHSRSGRQFEESCYGWENELTGHRVA